MTQPPVESSASGITIWQQLRVPVSVFVASRLLVLVISLIGAAGLPPDYNAPGHYRESWMWEGYASLWYRWDTQPYVDIARDGYTFSLTESSLVSWFPVYPMLMRVLSPLVGNPLVAGLLISNVAFLLALVLLDQLTRHEGLTEAETGRTLLYLALFPASLFFSAVYTESIFLLLSVLVAYSAVRRWWGIMLLAGILASATRIPGVMLTGLAVLTWLEGQGWSIRQLWQAAGWQRMRRALRQNTRAAIAVLLMPLGLVGYMAYLAWRFGNPLAFVYSTSLIQTDLSRGPINTLVRYAQMALTGEDQYPYNFPLSVVLLILVLVTLPALVRWKMPYAAYCVLALLLPIWGGPFTGMGRFCVVLFPLFMQWACWGKTPWFHRVYLAVSVPLLCIFTLLYIRTFFIG